MFRNVSLVISFTTIEWNLKTSDSHHSGSVEDYSVCLEMLRRAYYVINSPVS